MYFSYRAIRLAGQWEALAPYTSLATVNEIVLKQQLSLYLVAVNYSCGSVFWLLAIRFGEIARHIIQMYSFQFFK